VIEALEGLKTSEIDLTLGAGNLFYSDLMDWTCSLRSLQCELEAENYFKDWKENPQLNP